MYMGVLRYGIYLRVFGLIININEDQPSRQFLSGFALKKSSFCSLKMNVRQANLNQQTVTDIRIIKHWV